MAASDTPHALFSIAELLIGIVEAIPDKDSFWDNYDFRNTSFSRTIKTLLMLACVSKDFKEPALNTLWRRMSNFSPLFRLLPSNVVVHSKKRWSFVTPGEAAVCSRAECLVVTSR